MVKQVWTERGKGGKESESEGGKEDRGGEGGTTIGGQ